MSGPKMPGLGYVGMMSNAASLLAQHQGGLAQAQQANTNQIAMLNGYANAYTPPPETLESWFDRLERRVNNLLDRGEFMSQLEHMRWQDELEKWRATDGTNGALISSASMRDAG